MDRIDSLIETIELDLQRIAWQSLIFTIVLSIILWAFNGVIHQEFSFDFSFFSFVLFIIGYILLIILHEISHLIGFLLFAKVSWRSLEYGMNLKLGIAYATTNELVQNKAMRRVLILPFWLTGVLPSIIGIMINHSILVLLGAWLIAGATGDFAMYKELRRLPNDALVKDDPELPKLYVYENT
ncbi:MAG: DUF3267 domain-containing protein [Paenisporosarcina sp.]